MSSLSLNDSLSNVAVIGAAGKMGRGIALLLLQECISCDLENKRVQPSKLFLIDCSSDGLGTLRQYLDAQMLRYAERNIGLLRKWYEQRSDLIDNSEIINAFINDARARIHTTSDFSQLSNCHMVFEAVFEKLELKSNIYSELKTVCPQDCYFFTNTSSIPISIINHDNELNGRIIGFHFYNPPAVQKLVELISMPENSSEFIELSYELIKRLGKIIIPSNDIAGFIGNGHFIREGLYYLRQAESMKSTLEEALCQINEITEKIMIRPMGIFQLIDYVGLDVFKMICTTMEAYIEEDFNNEVLDTLLTRGVRGGQFGNGSQKDGFFKYEKGRPIAVYSITTSSYVDFSAIQPSECPPKSWKELSRDRAADSYLSQYFDVLKKSTDTKAQLAVSYLKNSRKIARDLLENNVANDIEHVNSVLKNGFYHLYGPENNFMGSWE